MKKMMLLAASLTLAFAAGMTSKVTIFEKATLNGVELKPGEYRMEVTGDKLTLKSGKTIAESTIKTEQADSKYSSTSVRYNSGDGKMSISEIRVGGTNTRLVVN